MLTTRDKYAALVEELLRLTINGSIAWESTSADRRFTVQLGKLTVQIEDGEGSDGGDLITLNIFGANGERVDRFDDNDLQGAKPSDTHFRTYYFLMNELHRRAGRDASVAEKVLDELLSTLGVSATSLADRSPKSGGPSDLEDEIPF